MTTRVQIDFISDFICPWCYIGKSRLHRIKNRLANEIELEIKPIPYILYPHIPKGGLPKENFARKVKPGMGRSLKYEAKHEGISINYKKIERIPYSLEAHRLVQLVEDDVLKYELSRQIFQDYFEQGQDIEDLDYLVEKGRAFGMSKAISSRFLFTDIGLQKTEEALQQAKDLFISVVPSIRLDKKIVMPGLQTEEAWESYIRRAAALRNAAA